MGLTGNTAPALAGAAAVLNPVWLTWLPSVWQVGIALLGAAVLVATLWNKILDIKQKRRELRK